MSRLKTTVTCALLFLPLLLSQHSNAGHTSGYLALEPEQARRYTQCQPQYYDHWYKVEKGLDLSYVLPDIVRSLSITSSPQSGSSSPTTYSGSGTVPTTSTELLQPLTDNTPAPEEKKKRSSDASSKPAPAHRILIMLEGNATPYTISQQIDLYNIAVGLCTQPPASVPDEQPIPASQQARILINDEIFTNLLGIPVLVSDDAKLTLESIQLDAHAWSNDYPVLLLRDRAEVVINNSTLIRLAWRWLHWGNNLYDFQSIIQLYGWFWGLGVPELTISNSRLLQGMNGGSNIYGQLGGHVTLINTEQVVAGARQAIYLGHATLDVIGGSISGCPDPVSCDAFASLGLSKQNQQTFFNSTSGSLERPASSERRAYFGWENLVNFQNVTLKGSWETAFEFFDNDRLKIEAGQNTNNQFHNFSGKLCSGHLAEDAQGAIEFSGNQLCPPGSQLASSQKPEGFSNFSTFSSNAVTPDGNSFSGISASSASEEPQSYGSRSDSLSLYTNINALITAFSMTLAVSL